MLAAVLSLIITAAPARGQSGNVAVEVDRRETFVGVPIALTITIYQSDRYILPDETVVDGARVQAIEGRSSLRSTQIINGNAMTVVSYAHQYRIIPTRIGLLTIPALDITVAGEVKRTAPVEVIVKEIGVEEGDAEKLILEVISTRDTFFLGEPVDATLRIWILPYRDHRFNITVRRDDMWRLINEDLSAWGEFAGALQQLRNNVFAGIRPDTPAPEGGETLRPTADGDRRAYYFFELRAVIWPKLPGELHLDDVQVMMEYPTRLDQRGVFRDQLAITDSRLIAAKVGPTTISIRPTPDEGRPPSFAGAVGQYAITVQAQPVEVAVGDPITIAIDIRDRTGSSRLDVLQPPPLAATPELADNFRIPTDPLAGEVLGPVKRFVQTIRAVSDEVTRIPPIQFAYFDPVAERYVTVESEPISLTVRVGASLSMTDIVEAPAGLPGPDAGAAGPTQLTEVAGGVLANYTGAEALLASQTLTLGWAHAAALALPPCLVGIIAVARRRAERLRTDERYARRRGARRRAVRRLDGAAPADPAAHMEAIAQAVGGYIADRCHLPPGAHTRRELVGRLRTARIDADIVDRLDALLAECEHSRYAGATTDAADDAGRTAQDLIERLDRRRFT